MTKPVPCAEWEPLLLDRAAGELDAAGDLRLDEHLASCAACRAESAALGEALALAELPPASEAERRALAGADRAALATWKRSAGRRRSVGAAAAALAVAAAALVFVASPGLFRRAPPVEAPVAAWQVPDLEEAWSAAAVADAAPASDDTADRTDDAGSDDTLYAELEEIELDDAP